MEKPLDRASSQAEPDRPENSSPSLRASRHRVRDAVFACILCVMLCGPAVMLVAERVFDLQLPSWLTAEDAAFLSGTSNEIDLAGNASLDGFAAGSFQTSFDDAVGKCVPMKGTALMTTSAWQRGAIEASNALFRWPCFLTNYDSWIVAVPSEGRLLELPPSWSQETMDNMGRVAEALSTLSERHPNVQVKAYLAPDSQNASGVPTAGLLSNPLTYEQLREAFLAHADADLWVDGQVTHEEFLQKWYKSDHHWNVLGAFQAYQRIATSLGLEGELLQDRGTVTVEGPSFYGSLARRGLDDDCGDRVLDLAFDDFPTFSVQIDGTPADARELVEGPSSAVEWADNRHANRYSEYFHGDYGQITITNEESASENELVLVADSYSNCMERFLAAHYRTTYVIDLRHSSVVIDEFLDEHPEVTDVVYLMRRTNFLRKTSIVASE
ncbi:DHHW family protein [Xiamenia xianingshaonis]|uniref:AlgX/AlgJ SGNH hydrolase-like domain-containing protein n=1 Tax=Xiamenia xianingshaonis TaxID=2682776 RepID=A0A9E6MPJ9_9ACTN|nr:DHHW family protein [Xiamenia xianingshaonis]NHM14482.1 hypothetical protein [Xiamenia xianingshaonis]QTU83775.1 hypothetical protein J7S26_05145 [Xiamenia xianingshaonis]